MKQMPQGEQLTHSPRIWIPEVAMGSAHSQSPWRQHTLHNIARASRPQELRKMKESVSQLVSKGFIGGGSERGHVTAQDDGG